MRRTFRVRFVLNDGVGASWRRDGCDQTIPAYFHAAGKQEAIDACRRVYFGCAVVTVDDYGSADVAPDWCTTHEGA